MRISQLNPIFCPTIPPLFLHFAATGLASGSAAGAKNCAQNNGQAQISKFFQIKVEELILNLQSFQIKVEELVFNLLLFSNKSRELILNLL